eukprot:8480389-Pyramimonas_sp.AAC.1
MYFQERHCRPLQASARMIVVAIGASRLVLIVCVAHAPHAADKEEVRGEFWEGVKEVHEKWGIDLLLCDANAHIGSECSAAVGPEGFLEQQDQSGSMFHDARLFTQHKAINTFISSGDIHHTY